MAKASNARKAKRAAAKTSGAAGNPKTVSKTVIVGKTIKWNKDAPLVRAAIDFGVAQGTTVITAGVVGQAQRVWLAIEKGQLSMDHAPQVLQTIENEKHKKRKAAGKASGDAPEVTASRVSEYRAIMDLARFKCIPALTTTLLKIEVLEASHLYNIAKWMRGPNGKNGAHNPLHTSAPPLETLARIARGTNKRKNKSGKRGSLADALKKHKVIGFPTKDTANGAKFIAKATKLFLSSNPEMNAGEKALVMGMLKTCDTLANTVAKRIRGERVKAAAEAAKKTA